VPVGPTACAAASAGSGDCRTSAGERRRTGPAHDGNSSGLRGFLVSRGALLKPTGSGAFS
jgi:hypothetical protein